MSSKKKAKAKKAKKRSYKKGEASGVLFDAKSLSIHKTVAAEDQRYAATNILIEPDGTTVATNGHLLVAVEGVKDDPDEFPAVGEPTPLGEPTLVPGALVKDVVRNIPKGKYARPILENALLTRCGKNGVQFTTTDLSRIKREGTPCQIDGTFPDWRSMMQRPRKYVRVALTVAGLQGLLDVAKSAAVGDDTLHKSFDIFVPKDFGPVLIRVKVGDDRRMLAMLGPSGCGQKDADDENAWEKSILDAE